MDFSWLKAGLDVEVDETPVFEESVKPDNATDIPWQVLPANRG